MTTIMILIWIPSKKLDDDDDDDDDNNDKDDDNDNDNDNEEVDDEDDIIIRQHLTTRKRYWKYMMIRID